ncbi:MAG TPA: DUF6524 family protein [Burkholderiales bacterium]|nr:DUF6524 family protein [Burkholderiales bacterium]
MADDRLSWLGVLWRVAVAMALVLLTYNPTGVSYFHWALTDFSTFSALKGLAGALLLAGWVFYLRAAISSLGFLGVIILLLILGAVVWLLVEQKILDPKEPGVLSWGALAVLGLVLGIGMSWSLVRRRITGQVDVDAVDR